MSINHISFFRFYYLFLYVLYELFLKRILS
nr:MAG TPA: hypothetical protein [Caudoviricetes sp.]